MKIITFLPLGALLLAGCDKQPDSTTNKGGFENAQPLAPNYLTQTPSQSPQ